MPKIGKGLTRRKKAELVERVLSDDGRPLEFVF
jgi:hypothetical protein